MKRSSILLSGLALALTLAGCSGGVSSLQGEAQPDLVVYNDSTDIIASITISTDRESQGVAAANDSPLLERGEAYGFDVQGTGRVTVELWDKAEKSLGRCQVKLEQRPVRVTLRDGRNLWIQEEQEET